MGLLWLMWSLNLLGDEIVASAPGPLVCRGPGAQTGCCWPWCRGHFLSLYKGGNGWQSRWATGLRSHSEVVTEPVWVPTSWLPSSDSTTLARWRQYPGLPEPLHWPSQALPKRKCEQVPGEDTHVRYEPCSLITTWALGQKQWAGRTPGTIIWAPRAPGLALEGSQQAAPAPRARVLRAFVRCSGLRGK